jgi:hypothetical protein
MHSICVPGSIFHTYVDVTSVIYQKIFSELFCRVFLLVWPCD